MSRATLVGIFLIGLITAPKVQAIVVAYEGFDYPNTTPLLHNRAGGMGWTGGWADNDQDYNGTLTADDTSLTSPSFPFTPVGDRISTNGGGEGNRFMGANFDMTQDGTEFFGSFLLRKNGDGGGSGDAVEFRLISNLTTIEALRLGIGSGETAFFDSGAMATTGSEELSLGENYFFVFKAVSSATEDDQFFASVYGPSDTVPAAEPETWDLTLSEAVNHVFNGVRLQTGGSVTGAEFDEIRIGNTWEDVAVGTTLLLGDFNGNSLIDSGDLEALVAGLYVGSSYQEGDIDRNGVVDMRDYSTFRDIYLDAGLPAAALAQVPEPTALTSIAVSLAGLAFVIRSRIR